MRELTKEQEDWVLRVNSEEFREAALKQQEADKAAMEVAQAAYRKKEQTWLEESKRRAQLAEQQMQPLRKALTAAGIKLNFGSYEGVWGSYRVGNGPEVDFDLDSFEHPEEDFE